MSNTTQGGPSIHDLVAHVSEHFGITKAQSLKLMRTPTHPHELRDDFAGKALIGWRESEGTTYEQDAQIAYRLADEMLKARLDKEIGDE